MRFTFIPFLLILLFACMGTQQNNTTQTKANTSIYALDFELNTGEKVQLANYKGKYILIVNTASKCGFTKQYDDLEKLYQQYQDKLIIIGVPSNEFGGQEPGSNEEIATFCKINYGVSFPITNKTFVKHGNNQHQVYQWLSDKTKNGWNNEAPSWNFGKYLVGPEGNLLHYFPSNVTPLSEKITQAIQ